MYTHDNGRSETGNIEFVLESDRFISENDMDTQNDGKLKNDKNRVKPSKTIRNCTKLIQLDTELIPDVCNICYVPGVHCQC